MVSKEGFSLAEKITVYVTPETHRRLKTAASARGVSLSDFMVQAAERAVHVPDRAAAARQMDLVRGLVVGPLTGEDIQNMRREGRRIDG